MIREDRELLAELARLNTEMASLALRVMDGSASADEQQDYAQRLIAAGQRLQRRAQETAPIVIEGPIVIKGECVESLAPREPAVELPRYAVELPRYTVEPDWQP